MELFVNTPLTMKQKHVKNIFYYPFKSKVPGREVNTLDKDNLGGKDEL